MCVQEWNMTFKSFLRFLGGGKKKKVFVQADSDLILHGSCPKEKSLIPLAVPLHACIWGRIVGEVGGCQDRGVSLLLSWRFGSPERLSSLFWVCFRFLEEECANII